MATIKTAADLGAQTMAKRKQTALASKKRAAANARITPAVKQKSTGGTKVRSAYRAEASRRLSGSSGIRLGAKPARRTKKTAR